MGTPPYYQSPLTEDCAQQVIVLIAAQTPTEEGGADNAIRSLIEAPCLGNCLDDLAGYLFLNDQSPTRPGSQTIRTHTLSFLADNSLLKSAARQGAVYTGK